MNRFFWKCRTAGLRFALVWTQGRTRWRRVWHLLWRGGRRIKNAERAYKKPVRVFWWAWWLKLLLALLDALGVFALLETIHDFVKWRSRPLLPEERQMAESVFGKSLRYDLIRLNERAWLGPKQYRFAYVSFFTVNSWGRLSASILIHELVHVWQYQRLGAVYLLEALLAQRTPMGYNYGGVAFLGQWRRDRRAFHDLNLEQQADLVMDYYRLKNGLRPHWGQAGLQDIELYEHFIREIRDTE